MIIQQSAIKFLFVKSLFDFLQSRLTKRWGCIIEWLAAAAVGSTRNGGRAETKTRT